MSFFEDRTEPDDKTFTNQGQTSRYDDDPTPSWLRDVNWENWYTAHVDGCNEMDESATPNEGPSTTPRGSRPGGETGSELSAAQEWPGMGWNAMGQQYQAAGLGAGAAGPSDPREVWLEGLDWEDVGLLRHLADTHRTEAPEGSYSLTGRPRASPLAWLDDVSWDDLFFVQTLAEARRAVAQNARSGAGQGTLPAPFSPSPASFRAAEPTAPPPLLLRLQAYRAPHPEQFGPGGAGSGSKSSAASGGSGVGQPAMEQQRGPLDLSENPELAAYRRWPRPPSLSDNPELGAYWRWPLAQRLPPTATPTVPRTRIPTPDDAMLNMATRIIQAEVGTGESFSPADEAKRAEAIRAAAWTMRNWFEVGEQQVNTRRTPYHTNRAKDWNDVFNHYRVFTNRTEKPLPEVDTEIKQVVRRVFEAPAEQDSTHGPVFLFSKDDYNKIPDKTKQASYTWHFGWDPGTPPPGPYEPDPSKHKVGLFTYQSWPHPTPTRIPTPPPTASPTAPRRPTATRTRTR